ncbi:MAG TPA: MFS transporter [Candidatus Limnocylindrales bacterium]|nr:MFS transporter [Candidatus Limnocylindrales bacterium]
MTSLGETPLDIDAPGVGVPVARREDDLEVDQPLRENRDFLTVLIGQGVSSFGDSITTTAMPLLVLALTGSGFVMGIVNVLTTLPDLLVGLFAGAYADRWDRRRMMFAADLGRALLTAVIPISVWLEGPTIPLILIVTFPTQVLRVLWLAAYTASVPGLVGRSQVARASAIFEAVFNVGWIVGPALAGLLAATIGPGATIAIDALTFLVSALAMLLVRRPLRAERLEETHLLTDIREGIRFVAHEPTLRAVLALWTTTSIITAGLTTALIFYLTVDRDLGAGIVGLVLSAFAVGSLAGSVVAAHVAFKPVGRVMLVGAVGIGISLVIAATGAPVIVIVAVSLFAGVLNTNVLVAYITLRTMLSPDVLLGRVGATARTLSVGLMPVGALITGILLDAVGGTATLTIMGILLVVAAAGFSLLPNVRNARAVT